MTMDRMKGLLVAEVDETGAIAHVWIKTAAARFARPLRRAEIALRAADLEAYAIAGATREALARWFQSGIAAAMPERRNA